MAGINGGHSTLALAPEQLRRATDPATLGFATTADLPAPEAMVGQERAREAIDLAVEIADERYNLYVAGEPGTGRVTAARTAVERAARSRQVSRDWCYVHNFDQPDAPRALALPAGMARHFARDIERFIRACRTDLKRAFDGETYQQRRAKAVGGVEERRSAILDKVRADALALGFVLRSGDDGIEIVPVHRPAADASGAPAPADPDAAEPMEREEFAALSDDEKAALGARRDDVEKLLDDALPRLRALEGEARERVRGLDHETATAAVRALADEVAARYTASADALDFLKHLRADIVLHADVFRGQDDGEGTGSAEGEANDAGSSDPRAAGGPNSWPALRRRYRVNVFVAHKPESPAPVVEEINPAAHTLLGRIEYGVRDGIPFTDHMMLKPGALHRANGGYLIAQARDLVSSPRAWEGVKRMLRFGMLAMESGESSGMPAGASLRPEPIPASVRIVLIGDRATYSALVELDPDFRQLFKVRADLESEMPRTAETEAAYARFVGEVARDAGQPPLDAAAVALLIEEGSRSAEDQARLSTRFGDVRDLTTEACYWARKAGASVVGRTHVARAIASRARRLGLASDRWDDMIRDGTIMIATEGEVVGQVNGLTVMSTGDQEFGKPSRITVRTSPGLAGVTTIERETQMSGPTHTKGVLVLSGYLAGTFATDHPLSLSASLCFEQVYDEVDGDSASSTELYAILSALAGVPLRQSIAVTGSVNQRGEIQAVGGVTHKVEGYFGVCAARGLTGQQGVIIPAANVRTLMLREPVIEAVRAGRFHIWAIRTVEEGIELLTGIPAGHRDLDGRYLEGTINARVQATLRAYSEKVRAFGLVPAMVRG